MKKISLFTMLVTLMLTSLSLSAQPSNKGASEIKTGSSGVTKNLYIDVHHFGPGKVKTRDLAVAHERDLAIESKFGVDIMNYWLDEKNGDVYCLASAPNAQSLRSTHAEAHGMLPDNIYEVTSGNAGTTNKRKNLFLDIHQFGPGKVTAKDVAAAHEKDLAVQKKYGVALINYWVDEKNGTVMCLASASDSNSLINTHKEAHGLIPDKVIKVTQHK